MASIRTPLAVFAAGAALGLVASGAAVQGAGAPRRYINLATRAVQAPFSDGVLVGDTLYLAGRIGIDPASGRPPAEAIQEARLALDGMKSVLAEAGMTMDDLVSVQVFCPDLSLYDAFNGVYRSYFSRDFPARAFVGSGPLLRGGRFEVQGIAVKGAPPAP